MRRSVSSLKSLGQHSLVSQDGKPLQRPKANWDDAIDISEE
jgi:hypothetical protein